LRRPGRRRLQGARAKLTQSRRALAAALLALALVAGPAQAQSPPEVAASSYILVDARDGDVLARQSPDSEVSIASATKLMTAYVARRSLELRETVVAPPYQALAAESLLGLEAGELIEVRDLLYGLLMASGNDAAVTLADASAGSQEAFVAKMNAAARRLDLDHTSYANPIGLDQPGNYSSARDLAELAVELRGDPALRRIFDTAEYDTVSGVRPRHVVNRNTLVLTVPWIDGIKTGYTLSAGYVLVGSGERRGVDLISVVLGAPGEAERDQATLDLLEYGFSLYGREHPVEPGARLASPEVRYQDETLPLLAAEGVEVAARRDQDLAVAVDAPAEVEGPIERGQRLGRATVTLDGELVERVPLRAARPVDEASLLQRYDAAVPGPRALAVVVAIVVLAGLLASVVALLRRRTAPA
jgi:serine-type D-Ala-D-Ala carboxypeptidase (penicillin-binding protein 5/6)